MIIVPKQAQRLWLTMVLDYVRGATGGANPLFALRLYRNDIAPNLDTVLADFVEATFPGYTPALIGADFPFPSTNADGFAESLGPQKIFTAANQSSDTVTHGWYLTFQSDTVPAVFFAAERIVPGIRMNLPGAAVRVCPRLTLGSRFAS